MTTQTVSLEAPVESVTFFSGGTGSKSTRKVLTGAEAKPTFSSIPVVDFSNLRSSDPALRKKLANEVRKCFSDVGFLYASNHGIPEKLQEDIFRVTKEFFALPKEEKMKMHVNTSAHIRGYEELLETKLDVSSRGDLKEAFNIGDDPFEPEQKAPVDLDMSHYSSGGPMNIWPEAPKDFRRIMYEYRQYCMDFSYALLRIIALGLDLEETYFDHMARFPMAGLRPLYYPTQEVTNDIGLGAHADYSWFTLVNQLSSVPALEVLNQNSHWISAPPIPNTLVVNVGDFLERATNDMFQSTVHRVVNKTGQERYSIPFFFHPSHDAVIEVVPTVVTEEQGAKYEPVKAGEWYNTRLRSSRYKHPSAITV